MPFTKCSSSQQPHYDGVACVLQVRKKPFGILVVSETAVELLEFNTQRWWPLPAIYPAINNNNNNNNSNNNNSNNSNSNNNNSNSNHSNTTATDGSSPSLTESNTAAIASAPLAVTTNSSSTAATQRDGIAGAAVATLGSQVYVVGGMLPITDQDSSLSSSLSSINHNSNHNHSINRNSNHNHNTMNNTGKNGGGDRSQSSTACHSFAFGANAWQVLPQSMRTSRTYPAAIGMPAVESLYVLGGRRMGMSMNMGRRRRRRRRGGRSGGGGGGALGNKELASMECYHRPTKEWTMKPSFRQARMAPAVVALSKTTFAVLGGYTGDHWTTTAEVFDVATETWDMSVKSMPLAVAFPKAVIVATAADGTEVVERFIVMGSSLLRSASSSPAFTVILSYHVPSKTWTKILFAAPKKRVLLPSEGCAVACHNQTLYTIGGRDLKHHHHHGSGSGGHPPQSKASSKQVLSWNLAAASIVKQRRGSASSGRGSSAPTAAKEDQALAKEVLTVMSSPRRMYKRGVHRSTTGSTGSIRSVPFSTIHVDGDDEGTVLTNATSIVSQMPSNRGGTTSTKQGRVSSSAAHPASHPTFPHQEHIQEEEEKPVATVSLEKPITFTDEQGMPGQYTGYVIKETTNAQDYQIPHGKGKFDIPMTGDVYEGEWRRGVKHGYGRWTYAGGDVFEGFYQNDLKHDRGTYQWRDGRQFEGNYVNDLADDLNGTLTWKNGTIFVGRFVGGLRTGKGVIRFPNNVRYSGNFLNGKYQGYGSCTFADGRVYTGYWKKGKAHGSGKLVESDGTILHDGEWKQDAPVL